MEELPLPWSLPPEWWERYSEDRETKAQEVLVGGKVGGGLWISPHPRQGAEGTKSRVSRL